MSTSTIKKIFKDTRVIILLVILALSLIAINVQPWKSGVAIRNVIKNGPADVAGISNPSPNSAPMTREVIHSINNIPIKNIDDYYNILGNIPVNQTVKVTTNKKTYTLKSQYKTKIIETKNQTKKITLNETTLGIEVYNAPTSNIKEGLDLQGGTRVLLQPEKQVSNDDLDLIIDNLKTRLNTYGLSDITIRSASDLSNNQYIMVEIAGINNEEIRNLIGKQGKFEAKIANKTVFRGGKDITYVCRSAECSGIDPNGGCSKTQQGWMCRFRFSISLSPEAAQKQANVTKNLDVITENGYDYLSQKIELYLDDEKVDELSIGADLKGRAVTDIQISGSGSGESQQTAIQDSLNNMKRLQTILITGSLPVKVNIVKVDQISPRMGKEFIKNVWIIALIMTFAITGIIILRYKKLKLAFPIILTLLSELTILLGFAALTKWNLDLISIAGILIAIGSGVDDQIVITDETIKGGTDEHNAYGLKQRIKKAFFIVMASYFTTVVAMLPLLKAGAGMVKGFAWVTIVGVSIGVIITRPTFAAIVKILIKEEEKDKE